MSLTNLSVIVMGSNVMLACDRHGDKYHAQTSEHYCRFFSSPAGCNGVCSRTGLVGLISQYVFLIMCSRYCVTMVTTCEINLPTFSADINLLY